MDRDSFWKLVDQARASVDDTYDLAPALVKNLQALEKMEGWRYVNTLKNKEHRVYIEPPSPVPSHVDWRFINCNTIPCINRPRRLE